ncbi:T-cell surface antigen CD2 [Solea senegalensis]|uniref:T-cell surface antigen CD2 n=1 Tax=Solea senegalensis TaxID=28829 RepID=A0AAV6RFD1_SOLSE|nr:T-cell surface antigen CD2 isoform X2 [Solea senegalensis]KAG7503205.1 T-cell surface antigen CD2 [Solea senegalensis]
MRRMAMKMAATSEITLLLLCCFIISTTDAQDKCDHYVTVGESFTVTLKNHRLSDSEKLKWLKDNTLIVDRKAARNGAEPRFSKGSKDDIDQNGSLKLKKINKDQAGKYTPEVMSADGISIKDLESVHLCVMDRVPEPKVQTQCQSQAKAKFTCSVKPASDIKYEWLLNNQTMKGQKSPTLIYNTKNLGTDSFRCKVSNQVSSLTSDSVPDPCYKPSFVFPKQFLGYSIWIFVGGGGGVVLVLIVVVIVCCVWAKRKKSLQIKDEEELRLRWGSPTQEEQQQQQQQQQQRHHHHSHPPNHPHHHHHHHQQQPAGHTGPRQHRSKQHLDPQYPRAQNPASGHPQPSPRRPAQAPRPPVNENDEQPPPLPQPRKKGPRTQRV